MGKRPAMPKFEYEYQLTEWLESHPDFRQQQREYNNEYARAHRAARTASVKTWKERNPEKARKLANEAQKRYYRKHKAMREAEERAIAEAQEQQRKRAEAEAKAIASLTEAERQEIEAWMERQSS